jgi:hypothetical protein
MNSDLSATKVAGTLRVSSACPAYRIYQRGVQRETLPGISISTIQIGT